MHYARSASLWARIYEARISYLLIAPIIIVLGVFVFVPLVLSLIMSTQFFSSISQSVFVGLSNYSTIFKSGSFWQSAEITGLYVLMTVPLLVVGALILAVLLNIRTPLQNFFKGLYYVPVIASGVIVGVVWKWIYSGDVGVLNYVVSAFGFQKVIWLGNPHTALGSLAVVGVWKNIGYYMIIYLAGLQTIPQELYEAAVVDGARRPRIFFSITLPLLRPITVAVIILATIAAFQSFDMIYIMTQGGPAGSTTTLLWNIYNVSFAAVQPGQGAAMGVFLFLIILVFSLIQFLYFRQESIG